VATGTPASGKWLGHFRLTFQKGGNGGPEVPFYNNIIGNFMVYQYHTETNLLQLFAHRQKF